MSTEDILFEKRGNVAIITFNREKKLNALDLNLYYKLGKIMNEVAKMDDIYFTVITGKGRFFSAGADVKFTRPTSSEVDDITEVYVRGFVANNIYVTHAFYSHPKILIVALNGPVVGFSAALVGWADFIYSAPHTFVLTPFSSVGLVTEGASSFGFVQRMGISKANEALILSKRIGCEELVQTGFVNKVFDTKPNESDKFLNLVLKEIQDSMGPHLNYDSMIKIKNLVRAPYKNKLDAQNVNEVMNGLERFTSGIPQEEFRKLASGEKKHKL